MIYKNKNILKTKKIVSVDVNDFISYLGDEKTKIKWYGISFQIKKRDEKIKFTKFENAFFDLINEYREIDQWFIQPMHSIKLLPWFLKGEKYPEIENLKKLFVHPFDFKGYILISSTQIQSLFSALFYYSYLTHSQDLLIFNTKKPFVIQFGQHLTLDVITTDFKVITKAILKLKKYNFEVKLYQ